MLNFIIIDLLCWYMGNLIDELIRWTTGDVIPKQVYQALDLTLFESAQFFLFCLFSEKTHVILFREKTPFLNIRAERNF